MRKANKRALIVAGHQQKSVADMPYKESWRLTRRDSSYTDTPVSEDQRRRVKLGVTKQEGVALRPKRTVAILFAMTCKQIQHGYAVISLWNKQRCS